MIKSAGKKLLVAVLGICAALTMIFGVANFNRNGKITAKAADKTVEDIIDLSKGPNDSIGNPNAEGASNLLKFHFKDVNLTDCSFLETATVSDGVVLGDLIVVDNGTAKTVTKWSADSGKRAFRIAVYGGGMYLQCENGVVDVNTIKYVTFKQGFVLFNGKATSDKDWGFNIENNGPVAGTEFPTDLKLYVNKANNVYQYATTTLTVATAPDKTVYTIGDTFDTTGMTVTAVTETSGTKTIDVTSAMCAVDTSSAGEKSVTVSYGGQTTSVNITVSEPTKTLTSIAIKSGSVTIEQNGSASEMTLNDLKITASYEGEADEEKTVTADMISVDPSELGERQGKITYTESGITKDCEVTVTVVARKSAYTADNTYVIPIDGYYNGEDGGDRKFDDSGLNIWLTTNAGYRQESVFDGLGEKWYSDAGFEAAHADVKAHVLINGKTFDEINAGGAKITRFLIGWYGNGGGLFTLRFHVEGGFGASDVQTITLLKGFRMYSTSAQALGAPTPCDYTYTVVAKPGTTSDQMLVRKTEKLTIVSAPTKTEYTEGDKFDPTGMTVKAVYTDGGEKTFAVKSRMADVTTLNETGDVNVTITYNGQSVTQPITVNEKVVTVTGITVKDNAKLFLKQYSLKTELTPDAKLTVSYSNGTSNDVDLTVDMVSGYTNETVGNDQEATVTYEGQTCKIKYDVAAYTSTSYFKGVNYGPIYGTEGTGYATLDGIDDVNAELKALWDVDKAPSLVMGKTNGDLVTINGVTLTQLVNDKQYASYKFARMLMNGRNFAFHIDDATFMNTVKSGAEICFLPGFSWVTYTTDKWGDSSQCANYTPIENAVITKPTYFCFKNGNVCKVIDSVTLVGTPKASYYTGDVIDVTGLKLSVKYKGFDAEEIALTADMCEYDFREAGNDKTVSITYDGKTVTFNVNVEAVNLTDVKLVTAPDKKDYDFGIENELNLNGLVVKAKYSNNTEANIPLDSLTVTGFDSRKFGVQTITAKYGDFEVTFEIEVKNISDDKYISIDYTSAATSYEGTQHNSLVVSFTFTGTYEKLNSYWGADKLDYVGDYMLINGTPVSKLVKEGKVTRLAVWASQIVIHLDTVELVPATWVDKRDADHPDAMHYVEGVSEVVETVTFLPGFQWYTVNGIDSSTLWGNDNAYLSATPIEGAVLKEKITIRNEDGYGWTRPLKRTDGVVDADALTVASLPNKTTYTVGDRFEANGLQIRLKYQDGGEELITPGASELGYKKDVKGKQTLTFKYDGATASFEVTVKEPAAEKKGCGGSIGAIGVSSLGLLAFAFAFKRKRK